MAAIRPGSDPSGPATVTGVPVTCPANAILLHACARAGFAPRIAFATDDYVAVQSLIAAGLGVALLPRLVFALVRSPGVAVAELEHAPDRTITAIVRSDERKPPAVSAALAALRSAAAGLAR
jgi:DNA-binding transcriptional LysR family regulator